MTWFDRLTGFRETGYNATQEKLSLDGEMLVCAGSTRRARCGRLELVSLQELRQRVSAGNRLAARTTVRNIEGDARTLHADPEFAGGLFQVASQFNLLEMISEEATPERGVSVYELDGTQGPACAMAAGAATIYRNYLVPVGGARGQTADRQLDALAEMGASLADSLSVSPGSLWTMTNGYALCTPDGLRRIHDHLSQADESARDQLRSHLRIGLHWDVEVTDVVPPPGPLVSQALCSALPVSYSEQPDHPGWEPFARLILEAAYEATLLAGVLNARRGASNVVLLTRLGGGAFGNDDRWIEAGIRRALDHVLSAGLDVCNVSHGRTAPWLTRLALDYRQS